MDACLTEVAPARETASSGAPACDKMKHWLGFAVLATIGVGVAWRVVRYLGGFPIWGDEAMVLLSILERDYAGLTQHLRFDQIAPLFFLWLEKAAIVALGPSEWSVHLFPFLAGLLTLLIFWRLCRSTLSPRVAGLAVALMAISYYPVRHSTEVKPYAFDLLFAVTYAWLALGHLRNPSASRWLIALAAVAPVAGFSSYTSVFVGGAVCIALLPRMLHASWKERGLYLVFGLLLCGSFFLHYKLVGQQVDVEAAQRTRDFRHEYWKDAFPPAELWLWPIWLIKQVTGNMLAYPMGGPHGASTLTFLLVMLGSVSLWRKARARSASETGGSERALLALCWLPFALNLLAAIVDQYPFGGSARITLHLAPFICILMAQGLVQSLDWIRNPDSRVRCELGLYLILLGFGVVGIARDLIKPYKTEHDRDIRRLVRDLGCKVVDGEPVFLCHASDDELLAEFLWNVRTQPWAPDWVSAAAMPPSVKSCWLLMCGHREVTTAEVAACLASAGWSVAESEARAVPGENARMPTRYCRWVRLVRD